MVVVLFVLSRCCLVVNELDEILLLLLLGAAIYLSFSSLEDIKIKKGLHEFWNLLPAMLDWSNINLTKKFCDEFVFENEEPS